VSTGPSDVDGADETDDRELIRRHLDGDTQAFGLLVERHRDRLWAVALRTLADREEAADAVQDALVSAYRRADSYRGEAAVTTWLHRIVVNACLDRMRRRKARPTSPLPEHEDTSEVLGDEVVDDPAEQTERRSIVMAALAQLSEDHRRAVVLVDMEGYSVDEAAELLGCPSGTVKSRCARARAKLLPLLHDLRGDDGNQEPSRPVVSAGDIHTQGRGGEQS
jgi:RNA polymerase sigma-70 factor (ECF subfamily)